MTKTEVTKIQKFCTHDGDGIRTTVFFKGCPLRCKWCHNPETQQSKKETAYVDSFCIGCTSCADVCPEHAHIFTDIHTIDRTKCISCMKCTDVCPTGALEATSTSMTTEEIIKEILSDSAFYDEKGGLTVSGGEPFSQYEALINLLQSAKNHGINTVIETSGFFSEEYLEKVVPLTDMFLWDIKDTDSERHRVNTGVPNGKIISNLKAADKAGAVTRLRCIMVSGVNMNEEHYAKLCEIYHGLAHCEGIELLPCHVYGTSKAEQIGMNPIVDKSWIPTAEEMKKAKAYIKNHGKLIK